MGSLALEDPVLRSGCRDWGGRSVSHSPWSTRRARTARRHAGRMVIDHGMVGQDIVPVMTACPMCSFRYTSETDRVEQDRMLGYIVSGVTRPVCSHGNKPRYREFSYRWSDRRILA